jgi:hypothetical protein
MMAATWLRIIAPTPTPMAAHSAVATPPPAMMAPAPAPVALDAGTLERQAREVQGAVA